MNSMHGPRVSQSEDHPKRQTILHYAREAFVAEGYAGAKMEPIARDAGVSTATLYSLFKGKAGLFEAVVDDATEQFARQISGVRAADGDARRQLTSFATAYAEFMGDPFVRSIFRLIMAERPWFQAIAARFFDRGRSTFGATLITILEQMIDKKELAPIEHPSWAAGHLMGMVEHPLFFVPMVAGEHVRLRRTAAEVASDAVETFLARYGPQG